MGDRTTTNTTMEQDSKAKISSACSFETVSLHINQTNKLILTVVSIIINYHKMQIKKTEFQDHILQNLQNIPDFTIKPFYCPNMSQYPIEKRFQLYESHYSRVSFKTFSYKATCKLKFECTTCSKPYSTKFWMTSLGVCDIFYRLYPIPTKVIGKKNQEMNHEKRKRLELKLLIMNLIYNIDAEISATDVQETYDNKEKKIKDLMENYQVEIDFSYRFYSQKCKYCKKEGKPIHYPQELDRIATNFARNIEKKLLQANKVHKFESKYRLKEHLQKYCEACKLHKCPYIMELKNAEQSQTEEEEARQKRKKDNPYFAKEKTQEERELYLAMKYKKAIKKILDELLSHKQTIKTLKENPHGTYPFSLIPKEFCEKLKDEFGKKFFNLLEIVENNKL